MSDAMVKKKQKGEDKTMRDIMRITTIIIALLIIISCGGGGSGSGGGGGGGGGSSAPIVEEGLTAEKAGPAMGDVITTIGLIREPVYIGKSREGAQSAGGQSSSLLNRLLKPIRQDISSRAGKSLSLGSIDATTSCTGGGTRREVANWSGSDTNPDNYTGVVTYTNCKEGNATWNGAVQVEYEGTYLKPTKITTTINNMTYTETNTNLTLRGVTIVYGDMQYSGNDVIGASATMTGNISGTVGGKSINIGYSGFKLTYSFSGSNMNISLTGKISPLCTKSELTVSTNTVVVIGIDSRCPVSGEVVLTDSKGNNAMVSYTSQGGMLVNLNNQPINTYTTCSQSEGLCM